VSGTSLACNDDVCGLQSQLSWPVTSGTSYTIQMGTFPGAAGGTGTFTIMAGPPPPTNDPCSNPDIIAGSGPFNFDSSQATTGAEGQSEAICNFFASTAINNDQWYRWTAPSSGQATLTVCGQSTVDTKAAVYPGTPQCPTAGSALTCNDDSCGLQSTLCWQVTSGSSYTIQMGTFPNATGGTGTFTINVAAGGPSACQIDDGTSEDALGFTAGGEIAWIQRFGGGGSTNLTNVQVSWGTPAFPGGAPGNGSPVKVLVYNDPNNDGDPSDAVLIQQINTTVANVDTDIFNTIPITPVVLNGVFFVGAGQIHASGQFVAPMDQGCPQPAVAWLFGDNTGAAVNYANPAANLFPPQTFDSVGFPANVMVRAGCTVSPMTQFCLPGSGGIIPCPCSNPPAGGGLGCNNFSAGPADSGTMNATGISSLGADSVVLAATGENNTSLTVFWQGRDPVHPTGLAHGAGVRCVTATLKRLYIGNASAGAISRPGMGDASVSARATAVGDPISAGQNRHYFTIYRDPNAAGPCGNTASTVNLTNAGTINWSM
jgi:hypothetical protein